MTIRKDTDISPDTAFKRLTIHDLSLEDRPREKMIQKGVSSLSDAELLAIILGSGNTEQTAVELAQCILKQSNNDLNILGSRSINELMKSFKGVGEAKAVSIVAAMELGRRRKWKESVDRKSIRGSEDVFDYFHPLLTDLPHEEFWILLLNHSHKVIGQRQVSIGGIDATVADVKIMLKFAIENLASAVAFCHNHPSGNKVPSEQDKALTKRLVNAFKAIDIVPLDHIIVAGSSYYSFADAGEM